MPITEPIIIVGAGVVGLSIAHGLKKNNIPFILLERSPRNSTRSQGWGLTIHWALPSLFSNLPDSVISRLPSTQVIPTLTAETDDGRFVFLDASDATVKFQIPRMSRRLRVHRGRFRRLLLESLEEENSVVYDAKVVDVRLLDDDNGNSGVIARLSDGREIRGSTLVGCDGSSSTIRRILLPSKSEHGLYRLPLRLTCCTLPLTQSQLEKYNTIDPLLFQTSHPETGVYMWYSLHDSDPLSAQLVVSWRYTSPSDETPSWDSARLENMLRRTQNFHPLLRSLVEAVPLNTPIQEVLVSDYDPTPLSNSTAPSSPLRGKVTLAGDAFHAMTMFRGEAANHGFLDAKNFVDTLVSGGSLEEYEKEVIDRTTDAVLLSRRAAMDAHDWSVLNENSPVVAKRAVDAAKAKL